MDPNAQAQTPPPPPPPPETPGWATGTPAGWAPAPQKTGSSVVKILIVIGIVLAALGGCWALAYYNAHKDAGKVLFTTSKPVIGTSCSNIKDQVTSIKLGTEAYAIYFFSSKQGDAVVNLKVAQTGGRTADINLLVSETRDQVCLYDSANLGEVFTEAGEYKFTLTSEGKTVAEGTLTVTE